ncbi:SusD/RagB family nutrient-binding outer membrane lipoprotein [Niabella insulamsoli]|uniref:SusD/RagB family nutrient-binding outer membrane lipoprotein n=1 Tax=Niabella insulamsoli TaxID=3144874 RepID=UPI0031FBA725
MKKIFYTVAVLITAFVITGCQKTLEEEFRNPELPADPPAGNLFAGQFTGLLYQWKLYIKDYGEYWHENGGNGIGQYAQINHRYITNRYAWYQNYNDLTNGQGFYSTSAQDGNSGAITQFNDHYTRMKEWAVMRDNIDQLPQQEQADNRIFYQLATIFKDVWSLRCVDLFNKIPYFDAYKATQNVFFPKYDDPAEIYKAVLNNFKEIASSLPTTYNAMSADAKALFTRHDIAFNGDAAKWVKYINAIRLQYAVKLAGVDQATATPHIQEALLDLPTTDLSFSTYTTDNGGGGGTWLRGVFERSFVHFIPEVIMRNINFGDSTYNPGIDDPRLPVLAIPTRFGDYKGVSMNTDSNARYYSDPNQRYYVGYDNLDAALAQNGKSIYNHATFAMNAPNFPAVMITLAEIDLLKAEVALKTYGNTGKAAGDHIRDAVVNSCNWWYMINGRNAAYRPDRPVVHPVKSDADISTYADVVRAKFNAATGTENKMEVLMLQKYVHLNISNTYELFAELRRTRHPRLDPFVYNNGAKMKPTPERLRYPASELQLNQEEYLKVAAESNYTDPIFWVPQDKRNVPYYSE